MLIDVEAGVRQGTDQLIAIYSVTQRIQFSSIRFAEIPKAQDHFRQAFRHDYRFALMNNPPVEFVYPANMVIVRVRGHRGYVLVENVFRSRSQAYDSEARINEQVPIATFHMPDIAPDQRIDIGFPQ